MTLPTLLTTSEVNDLSGDQFVRVFGNVIELCSDAAVKVKNRRPFGNVTEICEAFYEYLDSVSVEEKLVILQLHPDLAGRVAAQGALTKESAGEQRSAGLQHLTADQKTTIDLYNQRYKDKFGFPFIICARENKVQSIIDGLLQRVHNTKDEEISTGISEVKKICRLRIMDVMLNK